MRGNATWRRAVYVVASFAGLGTAGVGSLLAESENSVATVGSAAVTVNGVTVASPWLRATPGGTTVAVAYATISTANGTGDRLLRVSSPLSPRVELHEHTMDGEVMRMRRIGGLDVAAGGRVMLHPMGAHIMLLDIARPLLAGDRVELTFQFEKAGDIRIMAPVEAIGAAGPAAAPLLKAP